MSELDGWDPVPRTGRVGVRVRRAVSVGAGAVTAGLLVWYVVWIFVGIHGDGPVAWEDTGHVTACAPEPLVVPGDVTVALRVGSFGPYHPMEVRLIGPHNVALVEADHGAVAPAQGGSPVASWVSAGWPTLQGAAIPPDRLAPVVGGTVRGGTDVVVLHLHVDDPTVESGFRDVGIVYRAGTLGLRYEQRLAVGQRLVVGSGCS